MLLKKPYTTSDKEQAIKIDNGVAYYPATPTLFFTRFPEIPIDTLNEYFKARTDHIKRKNSFAFLHQGLRPYQNQDVNFLSQLKHKAIFSEQRTGKTPTTCVLLSIERPNKILIVCPGSVIYNWKQEIEKWLGREATIVKGSPKTRHNLYLTKNILIMSYTIATNDLDKLLKLKQIDTMIVDEAHRLRNFRGMQSKYSPKMTKAIMKLGGISTERIALSGTPAPNYPYNVFGILHFLYPNIFTSYWRFINYYFTTEQKVISYNRQQTITEIKGFKNEFSADELREFLEFISIQRKRKEVMQWIPKVDIISLKLDMTKDQIKLYKNLEELYLLDDKEVAGGLGMLQTEMQLAISPKIFNIEKEGNKTEYVLQYLIDYPEESVIIASKYTRYLKHLYEILPNSKILIGETPNDQRKIIEDEFNQRKFPILLGNIDVIKEGMKLERAETLIVIDPSLTGTDNDQLYDRFLPTTPEIAVTQNKKQIIKLISKDSIDEYIDQMLIQKATQSEIVNNYNLRKERKK